MIVLDLADFFGEILTGIPVLISRFRARGAEEPRSAPSFEEMALFAHSGQTLRQKPQLRFWHW